MAHEYGSNAAAAVISGISLLATDASGDSVPLSLTLNVLDDAPIAKDDIATVFEAQTVIGNVILGTGAHDVADTVGADGYDNGKVIATVTGVTGPDDWTPVSGVGEFPIVLEHDTLGTLTVAANGEYSFVAKQVNADISGIVFNYTIKDGDGDTSSSTLTLSITNNESKAVVTPGEGVALSEKYLPDGTAYTDGSELTKFGTFTISDTDPHNALTTITVNGIEIEKSDFSGSMNVPVGVAGPDGIVTLTITSIVPEGNGWKVTYSAKLTDNTVSHDTPISGSTNGDDADTVPFSFQVATNTQLGNTSSGTIGGTIGDDAPLDSSIVASANEHADAADHSGSFTTADGEKSFDYADGDFEGANGSESTGNILTNVEFGADDAHANPLVSVALDGTSAPVWYTTDGQQIEFTVNGLVVEGRINGGGDPVVTVTFTADGGYTYRQDSNVNIDHKYTDGKDTLGSQGSLPLKVIYKDAEGDTATGSFTLTVGDVPTVNLEPDVGTIKEGNEMSFTLSLVDDDGDAVTDYGTVDVVVRLDASSGAVPVDYETWNGWSDADKFNGQSDYYFQLSNNQNEGIIGWQKDGDDYLLVVRIPSNCVNGEYKLNFTTIGDESLEGRENVKIELVGVAAPEGSDYGNALLGEKTGVAVIEDSAGPRVGLMADADKAYEPEATGKNHDIDYKIFFDTDPAHSSLLKDDGVLEVTLQPSGTGEYGKDWAFDTTAMKTAGITVTTNENGGVTLHIPKALLASDSVEQSMVEGLSRYTLNVPLTIKVLDDTRSEYDETLGLRITGVGAQDESMLAGSEDYRVWTGKHEKTATIVDPDVLTFTLARSGGQEVTEPDADLSVTYYTIGVGTTNVCESGVVLKVDLSSVTSNAATYGDDMAWDKAAIQNSVAKALGFNSYAELEAANGKVEFVLADGKDTGDILITIPANTAITSAMTLTMQIKPDAVLEDVESYKLTLSLEDVDVAAGAKTDGANTTDANMAKASGTVQTDIIPNDTMVLKLSGTDSIHESQLPGTGDDGVANAALLAFTVSAYDGKGNVQNVVGDTTVSLTLTPGDGFTSYTGTNSATGNYSTTLVQGTYEYNTVQYSYKYQNGVLTFTLPKGAASATVDMEGIKFYDAQGTPLHTVLKANIFGFSDDHLSNMDKDGGFSLELNVTGWGGAADSPLKPAVDSAAKSHSVTVQQDTNDFAGPYDGPLVNVSQTVTWSGTGATHYEGETATFTINLTDRFTNGAYTAKESITLTLTLDTADGVTYSSSNETLTHVSGNTYTLTVPAGSSSVTILAKTASDTETTEGTQDVGVTITGVSGNEASLGTSFEAKGAFIDPPMLRLSGDSHVFESADVTADAAAAAGSAAGGKGAASYTINMVDAAGANGVSYHVATTVTIKVSLSGPNAASLDDFRFDATGKLLILDSSGIEQAVKVTSVAGGFSFTVELPAGQSSTSFKLQMADDSTSESKEGYTVSIESTSAGTSTTVNPTVDTSNNKTTTTIIDDSDSSVSGRTPLFNEMPLHDYQDGDKGVYLRTTTTGIQENHIHKYQDGEGVWRWPTFAGYKNGKAEYVDVDGDVIQSIPVNELSIAKFTVGIAELSGGLATVAQDVTVVLNLGSAPGGRCPYGSAEDVENMAPGGSKYKAYVGDDGNMYLELVIPSGSSGVELALVVGNDHQNNGSSFEEISIAGVWGGEITSISRLDGYDTSGAKARGLSDETHLSVEDDWATGPRVNMGANIPDNDNNLETPPVVEQNGSVVVNFTLNEPADENVIVTASIEGSGPNSKAWYYLPQCEKENLNDGFPQTIEDAYPGAKVEAFGEGAARYWVVTIGSEDTGALKTLGNIFKVSNDGELKGVVLTVYENANLPDSIKVSFSVPKGKTGVDLGIHTNDIPDDVPTKNGNFSVLLTETHRGESQIGTSETVVFQVKGEPGGGPADNYFSVGVTPRTNASDQESDGSTYFLLRSDFRSPANNSANEFMVTATFKILGDESGWHSLTVDDFSSFSGWLTTENGEIIPGATVTIDPGTMVVTVTFPAGLDYTDQSSSNYRVMLPLANDQRTEWSEGYNVVFQSISHSVYSGSGTEGTKEYNAIEGYLADHITVDDGVSNGPVINMAETTFGAEGNEVIIPITLTERAPGEYIEMSEEIVLKVNYSEGTATFGKDYLVRDYYVTIPAKDSGEFDALVDNGTLTITYANGHDGDNDFITGITYNLKADLLRDGVFDPNETFSVSVEHMKGGEASVGAKDTTTVVIKDSLMPEVGVTASAATMAEGNLTGIRLTASLYDDEGNLMSVPGQATEVILRLNGTGLTQGDFTLPAGAEWVTGTNPNDLYIKVSIPAGEKSTSFTLTAKADNVLEGTETFIVSVDQAVLGSGATALELGTGAPTGAISITEPQYTLGGTMTTSVAEGGTATLALQLKNGVTPVTELDHKGMTVTLELATSPAGRLTASDLDRDALDAMENVSYVFENGKLLLTVTLPANATSLNLNGFKFLKDGVIEGSETITTTITNIVATGESTNVPVLEGKVNNLSVTDDDMPTISVAREAATAGEGGEVTFYLDLANNDAASAIEVRFTLTAGMIDNSKLPGGVKHLGGTSYRYIIDAETQPGSIPLKFTTTNDSIVQADRNVTMTLGTVTTVNKENSTIGITNGTDSAATTAVVSEDTSAVSIEQGSLDVKEGEVNSSISFKLNLTNTVAASTTVTLQVDSTLTEADFGAWPSGVTATFNDTTGYLESLTVPVSPNVQSLTVNLPIKDDSVVEGPETMRLTVTDFSSANATVDAKLSVGANASTVIYTVEDDDSSVINLAASTTSVEEGSSSSFTLKPSAPVDGVVTVTVQLTAPDGVIDWVKMITEYGAGNVNAATGMVTVTLPANSTAATPVTVYTVDDNAISLDARNVTATIADVQSAYGDRVTGGGQTPSMAVTDNDNPTVSLSASATEVAEGDLTGTEFTVSITLDEALGVATNVIVKVANMGELDLTAVREAGHTVDELNGTISVTIPASGDKVDLSFATKPDFKVESDVDISFSLGKVTVAGHEEYPVKTGNPVTVKVENDDTTVTANNIKLVVLADWPLSDAGDVTFNLPGNLTGAQKGEKVLFDSTEAVKAYGFGSLSVSDDGQSLTYNINEDNPDVGGSAGWGAKFEESYTYTLKDGVGETDLETGMATSNTAKLDVGMYIAPQQGTLAYTDTEGNNDYIVVRADGREVNIDAGAGNDTIVLGSGDSTVLAGNGNDIIFAGTGKDILNGGAGEDLFVWTKDSFNTNGADTIQGFSQGEDKIVFADIFASEDALGSLLENLTGDVTNMTATGAETTLSASFADGALELTVTHDTSSQVIIVQSDQFTNEIGLEEAKAILASILTTSTGS